MKISYRNSSLFHLAMAIVTVIALALWVASRWHAWFGNVNEDSFSFATYPDRITLLSGEEMLTERTITWRCDTIIKPSMLILANGNDTTQFNAESKIVISRAGKDAYHLVHLKGLKSGARYKYQVITDGHASRWATFVMPQAHAKTHSFIYFGDVQDTIGGKSSEIYKKLITEHPNVDFWACGGDLIERPIDKYWNYLFHATDTILQSTPLVCATGNHDYIKGITPTLDNRWTATFANPQNGNKRAMGRNYFIDCPGKLRLIVVETNTLQSCIAMASTFKWLDTVLSACNDSTWKVVMMHHPAYSVRKGRANYQIRNSFVPLFTKHGVNLVLQGHDHGYGRIKPTNNNALGNTPVFIVSSMSHKLYQARDEFRDMLIIPNRILYQTITYSDSQLDITVLDAETNEIVDSVKITKTNN